MFLVVSPCDQIPKNTREQRYGEYIEGGNGKRDLVPKKTLVQQRGVLGFSITIVRDSPSMEKLAKENASSLMNSIRNWLPSLHMFFRPNPRHVWVSSKWHKNKQLRVLLELLPLGISVSM